MENKKIIKKQKKASKILNGKNVEVNISQWKTGLKNSGGRRFLTTNVKNRLWVVLPMCKFKNTCPVMHIWQKPQKDFCLLKVRMKKKSEWKGVFKTSLAACHPMAQFKTFRSRLGSGCLNFFFYNSKVDMVRGSKLTSIIKKWHHIQKKMKYFFGFRKWLQRQNQI